MPRNGKGRAEITKNRKKETRKGPFSRLAVGKSLVVGLTLDVPVPRFHGLLAARQIALRQEGLLVRNAYFHYCHTS